MFGDVRAQTVQDEATADAGDRLLAGRIDVCQDDLVGQRETVGKVGVEITSPGVEVRLEDDSDLSSLVQFAYGADALRNLCRMVGIVAQYGVCGGLQFEVEAAVYPAEGGHAQLDFCIGGTVQMCQGHGGYAVFNVDADRYTQLDVLDARIWCHEIQEDFAPTNADVLGMEVAFRTSIGIDLHAFLHVWSQCQILMDDECAARADEGSIVAEAFQVGFGCAVDVQVVGVGGGDDAHPRAEPME